MLFIKKSLELFNFLF